MSRKPSKFRKAKRAQRAARAAIIVDIETAARSASKAISKRVYDDIQRACLYGDTHVGMYGGKLADYINQLRSDRGRIYASAGRDEITVIYPGDLIHGDKR